MITSGDLVLFRFPQADLERGKLRPALLLRSIPNEFNDWLVCMVSTQLHQQIPNLEIIISTTDTDFEETGLKSDSLIRSSRLAVPELIQKLAESPADSGQFVLKGFAGVHSRILLGFAGSLGASPLFIVCQRSQSCCNPNQKSADIPNTRARERRIQRSRKMFPERCLNVQLLRATIECKILKLLRLP